MRVRHNMRYRGPMESSKDESISRQARANLTKLQERFSTLASNMDIYEGNIYEGSRETVLENTMPYRMTHMQRDIEIIERGVTGG